MTQATKGPQPNASGSGAGAGGSARRRLHLPDELGVFIALCALVALIAALKPSFLSPTTFLNLLANNSIAGMLALGIVFLLAMREIDLSFGMILNLSGVLAGLSMIAGVPVELGILIAIAAGLTMGTLNGYLSVQFRLPLIIITLGTASIYQGTSLIVNKQGSVLPSPEIKESWFFQFMGGLTDFPVPPIAVVFLVLAVILHFVLHRSRFGYRVLAIGSNPDSARLAGINVDGARIQVAALMGVIAGFAGAMFLGFRGAIDPTTGLYYLLPVIAAAIIGGTPLSGGSGTIIGAVLGTLVVGVIATGVVFLGVDATWSTFVTGLVIVVAVGIDQLVRVQRRARAAAAGSQA